MGQANSSSKTPYGKFQNKDRVVAWYGAAGTPPWSLGGLNSLWCGLTYSPTAQPPWLFFFFFMKINMESDFAIAKNK